MEKCKVMHIGHCHPTKYFMSRPIDHVQHPLAEVTEEKDLGILVTNYLKPSMQCAQAAIKKQCLYMDSFVGHSRTLMYSTSRFCSIGPTPP